MVERALGGVKVVEWCNFVTGPYCTKLLADLGAEVIKIELPEVGDEARRRGPFLHDAPDPERSGLFLYLNTNKLGVTLNLKTTTGKKIFRELVRETNILVEDKSPEEMKKLGLDYEALREINPRLVMTSISPFGQTGPYRNYKAYTLNTVHGAGSGYINPGDSPDLSREPLKSGGLFDDYTAGLMAAVGVLGALYVSRTIGIGQHVDISKQEAIMALDKIEIDTYPNGGKIASRLGTTRRAIPCKDGYFVFIAGRDYEWTPFVELMGNPEWAQDEKFRERSGRDEHGAELGEHISKWSMNYTRDEIYHRSQAKRIPLGIVASVDEVVNSPHYHARGFFVEIDHPSTGRITYPGAPYQFSLTPWTVERPAPLLGQHNEEVYSRRLGYTRQDLVKMRQMGII